MIQTTISHPTGSPYFYKLYDHLPTRTHNPSIVEYAETTVVPSGKYRNMRFKHERAPFLKEPLSLLSPDSPYRDIILMTPAQWGKSTLAELTTMYYIKEVPSEILYASSNETAAIKWLERRIVPRAQAAGIQFHTEVENRTSRKTGDTTYSKLFPGGNIDIASALSPAQLAQETKRIVLADEIDRWRISLGDEGSVQDMIRARTQAWGNQAKIIWISTPTLESSSLIYALYLTGDQRLYYVPCPFCGTMQLLDFSDGKGYGLKWEYKDKKIYRKSIELYCENHSCGRGIKESFKNKILNGGEWRPTSTAQYDYIASFNSNGLYSHMLSWYDMVVAHEEAKKSVLKKQAFDNLKMGRPHKAKGHRPKSEELLKNRGDYRIGEVPNGVLFLTGFIDVQAGSAGDTEHPARLEMEILGIGAEWRTWSIDYRTFYGTTHDHTSGAWEQLGNFINDTNLKYMRKADNMLFYPVIILVDSSSGHDTRTVYDFCSRFPHFFPSKGFRSVQRNKTDKIDDYTDSTWMRFRKKQEVGVTLFEISTVSYKDLIYGRLNIMKSQKDPQRPGYCQFPMEYGEKYFDMLTAEEKIGNKYESYGRRNEALDCRVGALCAGDIFLDEQKIKYRDFIKNQKRFPFKFQGITFNRPQDADLFTERKVIEIIVQQTDPKKLYDHFANFNKNILK